LSGKPGEKRQLREENMEGFAGAVVFLVKGPAKDRRPNREMIAGRFAAPSSKKK
jgi:hypothetical protein